MKSWYQEEDGGKHLEEVLIDTVAHRHKISNENNIVWHEHSNIASNSNKNRHSVFNLLPKKQQQQQQQKKQLSRISNPKYSMLRVRNL